MTSTNNVIEIKNNESGEPILIDILKLKKASLILRAINHKLRLQILKLIQTEEKITVTEIYVKLRLEQSVVSQHLAILRRAGFVTTKRDGKFIYYNINHDRLGFVIRIVDELLK
ncbi:ArsR/SmtB family transcription factor [Haoranjiania flava]|uniref:Metalloregulator ArsR/SmtB family transcription factor n=1 Tax=Haoranjiania flava TaxID=1856322 RepID=A0AAE3LM64_9BACT|nr:metalloregulator ArsR/SmtB family transcription factor [Haoranjiania flava]MCU7693491.1 metalloregulator ArsR/SmtB family transcription factor [Haoranjiania flava]